MRTQVVWLKAVLLIVFIGFSPSHAQENILVNGGFEDGVVDPWIIYGNATMEVVQELVGAAVLETPIEGSSCLHIVVPTAGVNFWDAGLRYIGHVFEAGKQYTLSAYLKSKSGTLDINFKPEVDGSPWTGFGEQIFTMTEEWAEYSVTTPVFAGSLDPAAISFHIAFAPGDFWVDDVRFYEVDSVPSALQDVTSSGDTVQGVPNDGDWPSFEHPALAIDDDILTKYLHFKGDFDPDPGTGGAGLQITPAVGPTIVTGLTLTTANDVPGRDPIAFELSGSNDSIDGPYTLIASGDIVDFAQGVAWPRLTKNETPIAFENYTTYNHYQIIFTAIRGPVGGPVVCMQIAEVELVRTPVEMLAELDIQIRTEVSLGSIDVELEKPLLAKVDAASAALVRGNKNDAKVAMNDLKALINQVEAQVDKKITPDAAAGIIQKVNAIIVALSG